MNPDYDKIAWCYDLLSYIIFGNTIQKAQTGMLNLIPPGCRILIAGGGTGRVIEKITEMHSSGLSIVYIDASKKMIEKAKRRKTGSNEVKFIDKPIEEVKIEAENYDVIITPFFFDNFLQPKCLLIFQQLHNSLKTNGIWLFTDFNARNNAKHWKKLMLKIMYLFFKAFCQIEAGQLPDIKNYFLSYRYTKIAGKMYYKGFIDSSVFRKS